MFRNRTQVDVVSVLMLLGESTIWKIIWSRLRSQRRCYANFLFSVSPGWAPLAATLLAWLSDADGPANLIFDRCPEGATDPKLLLTNLNSGATHSANSALLQNIWQTWIRANLHHPGSPTAVPGDWRGPRGTKKVGVVDIDVDALKIGNRLSVFIQSLGLIVQLGGACVVAVLVRSPEVVIVLIVALMAQCLLLLAILPHEQTWYRAFRKYRSVPVMLHKGNDTTAALIVRKARHQGRIISLEEFCWDFETQRTVRDLLKPTLAMASFALFVLQIIVVGWMTPKNRIFYLGFGLLGLLANIIEGILPAEWKRAYHDAFSGPSNCSPTKSSLMSTVGILIAGKFPARIDASKQLYPTNARFENTLKELTSEFGKALCPECEVLIRNPFILSQTSQCSGMNGISGNRGCLDTLLGMLRDTENKQLSDAFAAVYHLLVALKGLKHRPAIETAEKGLTSQFYSWEKEIRSDKRIFKSSGGSVASYGNTSQCG